MSHVQILMDLASDLSPADILNQSLDRLGGAQYNESACQKLEAHLNDLFYGTTKYAEEASRLSDVVTKYLEDRFNASFEKFDWETNMLSPKISDPSKIQLEGYEAFSHSSYIRYETVQNRLKLATEKLKELANSTDVSEQHAQIMSDLQSICETANMLLKTEEAQGLPIGGSIIINDNTRNLIGELDRLYQRVTVFKSMPLPVGLTGEVFEKALQVAGSSIDVEQLTYDVMAREFRVKTQGSQTAKRNSGDFLEISGLEVTPIDKTKDGKKRKNLAFEIVGDNNSKLTISGVFDEKQGKVDVIMQPPGLDTTFRVSAKNWASFKDRDFGTTTLREALIRSAGINEAFAYGIGLAWPKFSGDKSVLHQYGKMSAVADIVMGLSQLEGYADTIVINNRQDRHIYVYSMGSLLNKIYKNLKSVTIMGYDNSAIESSLANKDINWGDSLEDQDYLQKIYSALAEHQLRVGSGVLRLK